MDVLKQLDEEILGLVEEEKIANGIEQSDDFREGIYSVVVELDGALSPASVTAPVSPSTTNHFAVTHMRPRDSPPRSKVRLHEITLQPFDGDLTAWTPFWDSFRAEIHENDALDNIDKFNHLRGLLQHTALEAISGLALTSDNYQRQSLSCKAVWD